HAGAARGRRARVPAGPRRRGADLRAGRDGREGLRGRRGRRRQGAASGAAGLTSALPEMAAKGSVGVEVDVAKVPLREPGMAAWEVMVSESQERMLCVVAPESVSRVLACAAKWEIGAAAIGTVTSGSNVRV